MQRELTTSRFLCVVPLIAVHSRPMTRKMEWDREALLHGLPFAPLRGAIAPLRAEAFPDLQKCNVLLGMRQPPVTTQSAHLLRFVPQESGKLPFERQYEPRCYLSGEVPTRENNWHDLFNALVWLTFPKAKAAINARHYHALCKRCVAADSQRGSVRDMNTLFDESGVIVAYANEELAQRLCGFCWKELFWQHRTQVQTGMGFYLFGHGLYEKALQPYIGMTGQGLLLRVPQEFFGWPLPHRLVLLDEMMAVYWNDPQHCRSTRELTPVPLLGIPGWWADNLREDFYDNAAYFRPGRQSRAARTPLNTAPSSVAG